MKLHRLLVFLELWLALAVPLPAQEQERVLSYDTDVMLNSDGTMRVRETIRVYAGGEEIKHGIYRDFPTDYKDRLGIRKHVPFDIISVTRDGKPEDYHTSNRSNGVRVYMGPRFATIPAGEHTYELIYTTDRQVGFYDDRDELYWNVIGNGWQFPIEHATATIHLPINIPRRLVETYGYTGPKGYQGRDFKAKLQDDLSYFFETSKPLAPGEGFTVVCWWDKGYMQPPTDEQQQTWFFEDNKGIVFAVFGLIVVLIYQFVAWSMVGKDPAPGTIMPQYMPPQEISAAGMRELVKMGFDNKCFAASIVGMAAKKYLTIEKDALDQFTLVANSDPKAENLLSPEEKLVASRLFARARKVLLSPVNRDVVSEAVKALRLSLATRMEKVYFVRNGKYLLPSLALSLLTIVVSIAYSDSQQKPVAIFMLVWVSLWSVGVAVLMLQVFNLWRAALKGGAQGALKFGSAIFLSLFALPFLGGELFGLFTLGSATSFITMIVFGLLIASNFVFHELLKAPTRMGRELLDRIQGFKMFLSATEGDPIKRMAPVNWNVDTFNRFLPYAIALDVEEAWAANFSQAVTAASAAAAATTSVAYSGALAGAAIGSGFASSLGDSLTSAIASASLAPGTTSGSSGGGSSGGGGGGGGGGGW